MFIPIEEHDRHGVIDLIHLVEVLHLVNVANVDHREILDPVGDLVENFVLQHAVGVVVASEADED